MAARRAGRGSWLGAAGLARAGHGLTGARVPALVLGDEFADGRQQLGSHQKDERRHAPAHRVVPTQPAMARDQPKHSRYHSTIDICISNRPSKDEQKA